MISSFEFCVCCVWLLTSCLSLYLCVCAVSLSTLLDLSWWSSSSQWLCSSWWWRQICCSSWTCCSLWTWDSSGSPTPCSTSDSLYHVCVFWHVTYVFWAFWYIRYSLISLRLTHITWYWKNLDLTRHKSPHKESWFCQTTECCYSQLQAYLGAFSSQFYVSLRMKSLCHKAESWWFDIRLIHCWKQAEKTIVSAS